MSKFISIIRHGYTISIKKDGRYVIYSKLKKLDIEPYHFRKHKVKLKLNNC